MITLLTRLNLYRDLLAVFVYREFTIRYKQSIIGVFWAIFQPLSMMLMFTFIFTYVMPTTVSDQPKVIFFYAGILPWTFFDTSMKYAIPSLTNHYSLITKIYFPTEIIPFSGICVALIDFTISLAVFNVMMIIFNTKMTFNVIWFFPLLVILIVFTSSISLLLAGLNVYYRDVKLAMGFLMQLWFFGTPVFYSIDKLPPKVKLLLFLNPMTFIVENMRRCLIEGRGVVWWQYLIISCLVCLLSFFCYQFFLRTEKRFADVI